MNKLKSMFIGIYPVLAMSISGYAMYQLFTSGFNLLWLAAIMINLPIMMFISRIMMFKDMARTSAHFPLITLLAVAGISLIGYHFLNQSNSQVTFEQQLAIVLSGASFICYLLYNFWYSSLGRDTHHKLQLGNQLPPLSLTSSDGINVQSNDFLGSPAVLIFFRGNWCPLCMAQIKEVAKSYQELSSKGCKVALISPQPEKNTKALADKFNVPFLFLTDKGNSVAKSFGLEMKNGLPAGMEMFGYDKDTVYPTVIITDVNGRIIYNDFTNNYRIRPEPEEFITILNSAIT
jgi:peroxiredoxin